MKLPEEILQKIKTEIAQNLTSNLKPIKEGYVAQEKTFKQVSEYVSQKTKDMHQEIYKSYVHHLNDAVKKLDGANKSDSNSLNSNYKSFKQAEVKNLNGTWLHELYFTSSFDPNSEILMDSKTFMRLQRDFGTFDDWQRDFMATAISAGNGWAVLGYHPYLKQYRNYFYEDDMNTVPAGFMPILVVDMWEHAYSRDYGTDKTSYIVSQLRQVNWKVIEERLEKCEKINEAVKNGY